MNTDPTPTNVPMSQSDHDSTQPPDDRIVATADQPPPSQRYILREEIARGSICTVHAAWDTVLQREVALKLLRKELTHAVVGRRFVDAAQLTGQLQHPGIPPIYDLGTFADGRPFLVTKLIKGNTLDQLISRKTPINRLAIFEAICQTVAYAHAQGVIHCDLKPRNIMVGSTGEVHVMDWRMVKLLSNEASREVHPQGSSPEEFIASPMFMSPEQARGAYDQIDPRSDVFGLGALLCLMLTGQPPYTGSDTVAILQLAAEGKLDRALERLDQCDEDPELVALCLQCLNFEKRHRPQDAGEVARMVAEIRSASEEQAEEVDFVEHKARSRASKQQKQQRLAFYALGAALVVLLAGIVGTTYGMWRANQARQAEIMARDAEHARAEREAHARQESQEAKLQAEQTAQAEKLAREQAQQAYESEKLARMELQKVYDADSLNREQNELRLKQFENMSEHFARLIGGVNSRSLEYGMDIDMFVLNRLQQTMDRFDSQAMGNSPTVARIYQTLGNALRELGRSDKAIEMLEQARSTSLSLPESDQTLTAEITQDLAIAYRSDQRYEDSINLLKKLQEDLQTRHGPDHGSVLLAQQELAKSYLDANQVDDALSLLKPLRDREVRLWGQDFPAHFVTLSSLAEAHLAKGQKAEAINLFEQVRDKWQKSRGGKDAYTLKAMEDLAKSYRAAGRLSEAISQFELVRNSRVKSLGLVHPATQRVSIELAEAYLESQRFSDAITLYEPCRDTMMIRPGMDDPATLKVLQQLSKAYWGAGRRDDAIRQLKAVARSRNSAQGAYAPESITTLNMLAEMLIKMAKHEDALEILEVATDGIQIGLFLHPESEKIIANMCEQYERKKQYREIVRLRRQWLDHLQNEWESKPSLILSEQSELGRVLLLQSQGEEAERVLREANTSSKKVKTESWQSDFVKCQLGEALLLQKRFAEADPLLQQGYKALTTRGKTLPLSARGRIAEMLDRVVAFYKTADRTEEAAKWQAERAKYAPETAPRPRLVSP